MQHASDIDSGIEAGLADVIACTSSISLVDGSSGRLLYRGYDIAELAEQSSFEEVAYLLWFGRLPGVVEFRAFLDGFSGSMKMPVETVMILRMFPHAATPMEVLRTAVSSLGHWDPDSGNTRLDACLRKAQRITERIPLIIAAHQRLRGGQEPLKPIAGRSIAFNFLYTLQGKEPHPDMVKAMDTALILHADHELNASTFAARVTAATMTDLYSAMTSAIAALKGPLHGGANAEVMKMLEQIHEPEQAEEWLMPRLLDKQKTPGSGHRVSRCEDPRATILHRAVEKISVLRRDSRYYEVALAVEEVMRAQTSVYPNVDFFSAPLYQALGIPSELFTPIFAISRSVGWAAHILEQWQNNRLIRPNARYTGASLTPYVPIDARS